MIGDEIAVIGFEQSNQELKVCVIFKGIKTVDTSFPGMYLLRLTKLQAEMLRSELDRTLSREPYRSA